MSEHETKATFLADCTNAGALKFGEFKLKSGRISPYFFNAGLFHTSRLQRSITSAYASTLASSGIEFDVLFGPAYKGIGLACVTVDKLFELDPHRYGDISFSFNRKEVKDHGEGGSIVGGKLQGKRVVIIDDVITAGTAIREAIGIIQREGGTLVAIIVAFDRMEKVPSGDDSQPGPSTIGQVTKEYGIPVQAILTLDDVVEYLRSRGSPEENKRLDDYRARYKASD